QIWEQALMLAQPLQRGVREDERARLWRRPVRDVGLDPLDGRWLGRGLGQHFARTVDGAQGPVGPAAGDGAGMDTGAAAELVERAGRQLADARQELEAGPEPLVAELEVKRWVPRHDHLVRCRRRHAGQNWLRFVIFRFAAGFAAKPPHIAFGRPRVLRTYGAAASLGQAKTPLSSYTQQMCIIRVIDKLICGNYIDPQQQRRFEASACGRFRSAAKARRSARY